MGSQLIAASYIANPDDQIWKLLVPSPQDLKYPDRIADDVDKMIENGED